MQSQSRLTVSASAALLTAALLYTVVCTFPLHVEPLAPGLDPSWHYALNRLAQSPGVVFGRDVAFTYGPWGFLMSPVAVGGGATLRIAAAFWTLLHLALFALAGWRLWERPATLWWFCGAYLILCALGMWPESRFIFLVGALVLLSLEDNRWAAAFSAGAALLACAGLQIKWSLGISALIVMGLSWIGLARGHRWKVFAVGAISALVAFVGFAAINFRSASSTWLWIQSSMQIASGYSAAMSMDGGWKPLLLASAATASLVGLYFFLTPGFRVHMGIFAGVCFLSFKEGFVRQDGHRMAYFLALTMIPAILPLAPRAAARDGRRVACAFLLMAAFTVYYSSKHQAFPALRGDEVRDFLRMRTGWQRLREAASPQATLERLRAAAAIELQPSVLPDEWRTRLQKSHATVGILPSELSIAAANEINWQPAAVLQLYSAYTSALDDRTARAIASRGPEYLIVTYDSIDARNPLMDTPLTWRAVMERYRVEDVDIAGRRALLHRGAPRPQSLTEIRHGRSALGEWVPLNDTTTPQYAALDASYTTLGRLSDLFYHVPPLFLETVRQSGRGTRNRLIARTAAGGVPINYPPENQYELEQYLQGRASDPVIRFRLLTDSQAQYFQKNYAWRLLEGSGTITPLGARPQPPTVSAIQPDEGKGRGTVLEFHISDPNGVQDVRLVQLLIARELNGVRACYLSYAVSENRLWLIADAGSGEAGHGRPGDRATLANAQCSVPLERMSTQTGGNSVTLRIAVDFKPSMSGAQHLYVMAQDQTGLRADWQLRGDWTVE